MVHQDNVLNATVPVASERALRQPFLQRNAAYFWGLFNGMQRSSLLPLRWRTHLLRKAGCSIHPSSEVREDVFIGGASLRIERGCYVNTGCLFDGSAPITIGEFTRVGPRVTVLTGTHTYQHSVIRRGPASRDIKLPVVIGRGCWIGVGAILLPGVVVGEGCVIAAGAVVLKSTEPNGLYAGNPAQRVRDLPV